MPQTDVDTDEFRAFVRKTYPDVRAYALRRVGGGAVDDVVSETYIAVWRSWRNAPPADPRPWLFGVARNVIRNEQRRAHRSARLAGSLPSATPAWIEEPSDALAQAFAVLSDDDQELLRLVAWDGLQTSQIGEVLNIRPGTAATRLSRARQRLAAALEDQT